MMLPGRDRPWPITSVPMLMLTMTMMTTWAFSIEEFCATKSQNNRTLSCHPEQPTQKIFCPTGEIYECPPAPLSVRPARREICQPLGPQSAPRCVPDLNETTTAFCARFKYPGFYCHPKVTTVRVQCPEGWIWKCTQTDYDLNAEKYGFVMNQCNQTFPTHATCERLGPHCHNVVTRTIMSVKTAVKTIVYASTATVR